MYITNTVMTAHLCSVLHSECIYFFMTVKICNLVRKVQIFVQKSVKPGIEFVSN